MEFSSQKLKKIKTFKIKSIHIEKNTLIISKIKKSLMRKLAYKPIYIFLLFFIIILQNYQ